MQSEFTSIGQYTMIRMQHTRTIRGQIYTVFVYGAYNALGLIGSEYNGIGVVNESSRKVVLDGYLPQSSGYYGASTEQARAFGEIRAMSDTEFIQFINTNPRTRDDARIA